MSLLYAQCSASGAGGGSRPGVDGGTTNMGGGGPPGTTGRRFICAMPTSPDGSTAEKVAVNGTPGARYTCGTTMRAPSTLLLYGSVKALLWQHATAKTGIVLELLSSEKQCAGLYCADNGGRCAGFC